MSLPLPFTHAHLIGGDDAARALVTDVVRRIAPTCVISVGREIPPALAPEAASSRELLVLLDPQAGDIAQAGAALDAQQLPRWALVARLAPDSSIAIPPGMVCVAPDAWNAPALENALRNSARLLGVMRENTRLRGDLRTLSRRYSHDLRTPLNCVSTASDALRSPDDTADSASAIFLQSITTSVDDVSRLLERVGFVLKASADPVQPGPVSMGDVVWAARQRLQLRLMKQGVTVISPEQWPTVEGVAPWLEVIWGNLLANSLQYAGAIREIHLGWSQLGQDMRFWVRDGGVGVSADKQTRLFHPFHRLNELNAPRGFGLPIVRRLVELQGGHCGYEVEPLPGGTFHFTLPAAAPH